MFTNQPPLENKPAPLVVNDEIEEFLILKNNLIANFRAQSNYITPDDPHWRKTPHMSDSYGPIFRRTNNINWDHMPTELRSDKEQVALWRNIKDNNENTTNLKDLFGKLEMKEKLLVKKENTENDDKNTRVMEFENSGKLEPMEMNEVDDTELDQGTDYYYVNEDDDDDGYTLENQGKEDEGPCY